MFSRTTLDAWSVHSERLLDQPQAKSTSHSSEYRQICLLISLILCNQKADCSLYLLDSVLLNFTVSIVSTIVAQSSATPLLPATNHILSECLCKLMKWSSRLSSVQILMSAANVQAKTGSVCLGSILEAAKVMKGLWFPCLGLGMWGQLTNCLHHGLITSAIASLWLVLSF